MLALSTPLANGHTCLLQHIQNTQTHDRRSSLQPLHASERSQRYGRLCFRQRSGKRVSRHASKQALTVLLQHEVHVCDGAQPKRVLAVADAVDVLRDLLHPLVQPDGLPQLLLLTDVPDIGSKVIG